MHEDDLIKNAKHLEQVHSFNGMVFYRGITPTDIDGVCDFGGKGFFVMEGKRRGATIPPGQKRCIERMIDAWQRGGVCSVAVLYEHDCEAPQVVEVANCQVKEFYYNRKWRPIKDILTTKQAVSKFIDWLKKSGKEI